MKRNPLMGLIRTFAVVMVAALALPGYAEVQTFTGELTREDRQLEGGEFADYVRVELKAGQMLTVSLSSDQFDTWLQVTSPDNELVTNDNADDEQTNSQISFMVPKDGQWVIWVSSAKPGQTGNYQLSVSTVDTRVTSTVQGELGEGDQFSLKSGEWCDPYTFDLEPNQVLVVRLLSEEFDTYLTAYQGGERYFSDDNFDESQSVVVLSAGPEGATVTIVVTSYDDTGAGKYTLEYRALVAEGGGR